MYEDKSIDLKDAPDEAVETGLQHYYGPVEFWRVGSEYYMATENYRGWVGVPITQALFEEARQAFSEAEVVSS